MSTNGSAIVPYWQSPDGAITVYCDRWENVHAAGLVPVREVALVHADPPYGVSERTDRASKGRGKLAACNDFPACAGDTEPFDPSLLLSLKRPTVMWGANHYCDSVPGSPSWIVWDKREGMTSNDNADCEMASEQGVRRIGGTQKPIALSTYVFGQAKVPRSGLVFVPYLGSGPDLPAALAVGLRVIACDVSEEACRVAVGARCGAVTAERAAEPAGPLFAARVPA